MINQANTAFVLISTILVFFMTPGLAFFMEDWFLKRMSLILCFLFLLLVA